jgi:ATPase subunit of ABC transporter with duplicated ATPase domains
MGDPEFRQIRQERDRMYSLPKMSEADGMKVADLETRFAELDGYTSGSRASELLRGVGIPLEMEAGLMREVAPGWKLRVLLAQALFGNPDVLLLE